FARAQAERDRLLDERRVLTGKLRESSEQIASLKDQIVYQQRSQEIDRQACGTVQASLTALQDEVADLQEQVAFYRGIVSPEDSRAGVRIYEFRVYPTATPEVFRYGLVLIQSVRHDRRTAGHVEVTLEGLQFGKTQTRRLSELMLTGERELQFSFKYFEEFGGEFRLPDGFRPLRAVVTVLPRGGTAPKIEDGYEWSKIQGT
ncbi:MAG: hypothetical protein L0Y32_06570, partial [Nevskiales bacterium]|nr:hypothetical protein [Nevskiales bacterium]